MLKKRLVFGTLMAALFAGIVVGDGWLDGSLTSSTADDKPIQATALLIVLMLVIICSQFELAKLAAAKGLKSFVAISIVGSALLATASYVQQMVDISAYIYSSFMLAFVLMAVMLFQYLHYGTSAVLANCGVTCFCTIYLGILCGFCTAVRIEFGPLALLMFIFVVKSADIGAYTFGTLFGKHKFSPRISPGKTWEGMAGGVVVAVVVSVLFARSFDIMMWWSAVVFGVLFAFIGQLGDLAESMVKRDAEKKDSSNNVPGFGGILDVIDSVLMSAPFAYLFFMSVAA